MPPLIRAPLPSAHPGTIRVGIEGGMRGIGRDHAEKRLLPVVFHEAHGFIKEYIRAVPLEGFRFAIHQVRVVEIIVAPPVRLLPDTATTMTDNSLETPVLRAVREIVPHPPQSMALTTKLT